MSAGAMTSMRWERGVFRAPAASAGLSGAGYAPVSRLSPVRDVADLQRLILLVQQIRLRLRAAGVETTLADDLLRTLRSELARVAPADASRGAVGPNERPAV